MSWTTGSHTNAVVNDSHMKPSDHSINKTQEATYSCYARNFARFLPFPPSKPKQDVNTLLYPHTFAWTIGTLLHIKRAYLRIQQGRHEIHRRTPSQMTQTSRSFNYKCMALNSAWKWKQPTRYFQVYVCMYVHRTTHGYKCVLEDKAFGD